MRVLATGTRWSGGLWVLCWLLLVGANWGCCCSVLVGWRTGTGAVWSRLVGVVGMAAGWASGWDLLRRVVQGLNIGSCVGSVGTNLGGAGILATLCKGSVMALARRVVVHCSCDRFPGAGGTGLVFVTVLRCVVLGVGRRDTYSFGIFSGALAVPVLSGLEGCSDSFRS